MTLVDIEEHVDVEENALHLHLHLYLYLYIYLLLRVGSRYM
jgi:hypothetical protein